MAKNRRKVCSKFGSNCIADCDFDYDVVSGYGGVFDVTDEELEAIPLLDCPSCDSRNTSVRRASQEWWLVGCLDCWNKRQCQRQFVEEVARKFNEYARRCGK